MTPRDEARLKGWIGHSYDTVRHTQELGSRLPVQNKISL